MIVRQNTASTMHQLIIVWLGIILALFGLELEKLLIYIYIYLGRWQRDFKEPQVYFEILTRRDRSAEGGRGSRRGSRQIQIAVKAYWLDLSKCNEKSSLNRKKVLIKAICLNYVVIIGSLRCIGQRLTTDGGCGDCRYFHPPTTLSPMHGYPLHYPLHIFTKPFL